MLIILLWQNKLNLLIKFLTLELITKCKQFFLNRLHLIVNLKEEKERNFMKNNYF